MRYVVGEDGLGEAYVGLKKYNFLSSSSSSSSSFPIGLGCYNNSSLGIDRLSKGAIMR